jgi:hypothetical protein
LLAVTPHSFTFYVAPPSRSILPFYFEAGHADKHVSEIGDLALSSISNERVWITSKVVLKNPTNAKWRKSAPLISSGMKTNTLPRAPGQIRSHAELQQQIHDALRVQHPEWIEPNGDCPTCESYESRLAELLRLSSPSEHRSAA